MAEELTLGVSIIPEGLRDFAVKVKDAVGNISIGGAVSGAAGGAKDMAGAAIGKLLTGIAGTAMLIGRGMKKLSEASPALGQTQKILEQTLNAVLRPIGDAVAVLIIPFIKLFYRLFLIPFYQKVYPAILNLSEWANEMAIKFENWLGGVGESLGETKKSIDNAAASAREDVKGFKRDVDERFDQWARSIDGFKASLSTDFQEFGRDIGETFNAFNEWGSGVKRGIDNLGPQISQDFKEFGRDIGGSIDGVKAAFSGVKTWFDELKADIKESVITGAVTIGQFFIDLPGNIAKAFTSGAKDFADGVSKWFDKTFSGTNDALSTGTVNTTINVNNPSVRSQSDIDNIAEQVARRMREQNTNYGTG